MLDWGTNDWTRGGSRSMSSAAMMKRKLMASMENADATPNAAMMIPAVVTAACTG